MEFTNTFTIPVGADEAFAILTDLEKVAPCMPGAKLETVDGDAYTGRVKVKVGPMSLTYRGTAEVVDKDPETHSARISAKGNEARGGGTANADVSARLTAVDGGTEVVVDTSIDITGKPAQFGRGVMADVGAKIIDRFAECLSTRLAGDDDDDAAEDGGDGDGEGDGDDAVGSDATGTTTAGNGSAGSNGSSATATASTASASSSGPRKVVSTEPEAEVLDLFEVAGGATAKRAVPVIAAVTIVGLIIWLLRRKG